MLLPRSKLDEILHFEFNSPDGADLPGYYRCPELLRVIYPIHTHTTNFRVLCTTFIPVAGTSVSTVRPCHNTRNFCEFCNISEPVPETSGSSKTPIPLPRIRKPYRT